MPTKEEIRADFESRKKRLSAKDDIEARRARLRQGGTEPQAVVETPPSEQKIDTTAGFGGLVQDLEKVAGILSAPGDVVKIAMDAAAGEPEDTFSSLYYKKFVNKDKDYRPGDISLEHSWLPKNFAGRLAQDIATDPTTLLGLFASKATKAIPAAQEAAQAAVTKEPGATMRGLNKVLTVASGGRINPEWATAAANTAPVDQMLSPKYLEEAKDTYTPLKNAAREVMSGRASAIDEGFKPIASSAGDDIGAALAAAQKKADDVIGEFTRANRPIPPDLQGLRDRIASIVARGKTHGAEAGEILDTLNDIGWTPFGNPRAVKGAIKSVTGQTRGAMNEIAAASHPEFAAAKDKLHNALNLLPPAQTGGQMTQRVFRAAPMLVGGGAALQSLAAGDLRGAAVELLVTGVLQSPTAINFIVGAGRGGAEALRRGAPAAVAWLEQNPEVMAAIISGVAQTTDTEATQGPAPEQQDMQQPAQGQMMATNAPQLSPQTQQAISPQAPPIPPQDAMLMQETGLQSIVNGRIMDPMEREKFVKQVMDNDNLSVIQKSKIRLHLQKTDGEIMTPEMLSGQP